MISPQPQGFRYKFFKFIHDLGMYSDIVWEIYTSICDWKRALLFSVQLTGELFLISRNDSQLDWLLLYLNPSLQHFMKIVV
jgi:hypothetical protein